MKTAAATMNRKIAALTTAQLMEIILKLATDVREEASIVSNAAMDVLMERVSEERFVAFCGEVEAKMG